MRDFSWPGHCSSQIRNGKFGLMQSQNDFRLEVLGNRSVSPIRLFRRASIQSPFLLHLIHEEADAESVCCI